MTLYDWYKNTSNFTIAIIIVIFLIIIVFLYKYRNSTAPISYKQEPFVDSGANKKKNILVLYYAEWCGHCQNFLPVWREYKKIMANDKNLIIQEVNCENEQCPVQGYPTVKLYIDNGDGKQFEILMENNHRDLQGLSNFVSNNRI